MAKRRLVRVRRPNTIKAAPRAVGQTPEKAEPGVQFADNEVTKHAAPKISLLSRIQDFLKEDSKLGKGRETRLDDAADAFVRGMELGEFSFLKEYMDRENGKAVARIGNADGAPIKAYIGLPIDDDPNAP